MIGDNQPTMSTDAFLTLKRELESYPRLAGYYLIKMIDITDLRSSNLSAEQIAEAAFQQLDDRQWPPADVRPTDQTWSDYIVDRETAARETVAALVGGPGIGHTANTIHPQKPTPSLIALTCSSICPSCITSEWDSVIGITCSPAA